MKVSITDETVLQSKGMGWDVIHRHLRISELVKTKNILTTVGQHSTQNVFFVVTKGFQKEKWEP